MQINLSILLFPGVIFHEFSHYVACKLLGIKVMKVKWFSTSEAYVVHAVPNAWKATIITIAPFLLGNAFGIFLFISANDLLASFNPLSILFYWFAISIVYFSFPSDQDAKNAFGSIVGMYKRKLFGSTPLPKKLIFAISIPFIFIPVVFILGFLLLFSYSSFMRAIWLIIAIAFSLNPAALFELFILINSLIFALVNLFI